MDFDDSTDLLLAPRRGPGDATNTHTKGGKAGGPKYTGDPRTRPGTARHGGGEATAAAQEKEEKKRREKRRRHKHAQ